MPELPEVETIRSQLTKILPFKIQKMELSPVVSSILKEKSREFNPNGKTILEIDRKGKLLNFILENDQHILSHLGMSGSWRISETKVKEKHTHLQFTGLVDGQKKFLAYIDPRRFGNMYFYKRVNALKFMDGLGVDVSKDEFNDDYLHSVIKRFPEKQIKPFLLEQKYFSGVGNYMASEICALAGVRPSRRLAKITKVEVGKLVKATKDVIEGQIKYQGLSFSGGYKDAFGDDGGGLNNLVVFHQQDCGMCGESVKKIVMATRGTYYCPKCQK
jgi:formamidopyrimidine-DNA glycosylase